MFYFPNRLNWFLSSIWKVRFVENCLIELWGFSRLGGVRCEDEEILSRGHLFYLSCLRVGRQAQEQEQEQEQEQDPQ